MIFFFFSLSVFAEDAKDSLAYEAYLFAAELRGHAQGRQSSDVPWDGFP